MDNPDGAYKTIINVKGIRKLAREAAKRGAAQQGESMGTWLSDAIDQRVIRDADQVRPPAKNGTEVGNPTALTPDQLPQRIMAVAALQQSTAALKQATGRATGKITLLRCLASLEQRIEDAEGPQPRRIVVRSNGHFSITQSAAGETA